MNLYIPCEISVDTVTLNWYEKDISDLDRWRYNPPDSEYPLPSFTRFLQDGVTLKYAPVERRLSVSFSAGRVANGLNCFEYTNNEYDIVKDTIVNTVCDEIGVQLCFEEGTVSRLDVYRSFTLPQLKDCKKMIKWLQEQPVLGKFKKKTYSDTGEWRWFASGLILKAYIKNLDPHLPREVCDLLPPTVRIEAECYKGFRRKLLGTNVKATILKYPSMWVEYFNATLDKFKLNGLLVNQRELHKEISRTLREEKPSVRQTTINKHIHVLDRFLKHDSNARADAVRMMNKIYAQGVCPFPAGTLPQLVGKTLAATAVISVAEQQIQESIMATQSLYQACIAAKMEEKSCKKTILYTPFVFTITLGPYHVVPIRDSS